MYIWNERERERDTERERGFIRARIMNEVQMIERGREKLPNKMKPKSMVFTS